jgi:hypothetical protein
MLRRKSKSAPFEIMGNVPPAPPVRSSAPRRAADLPPPDRSANSAYPSGTGDIPNPLAALATWWDAAKAPVVLRIPRGYLVLIAVGVLTLLLAAYWTGDARGRNAIKSQIDNGDIQTPTGRTPGQSREDDLWPNLDDAQANPTATGGAPGRPLASGPNVSASTKPKPSGKTTSAGGTSEGAPSGGATSGGGGATSGGGDPRVPGLNYLILARYPADEARRLIDFLAANGVAALGVSADNAGLYFVVAARGFDSDQWNGPEGKQYEAKLRDLGNAWKQHNHNKGDDLHSMYFSRFTPGR